jgi:phenol hydroxylase P4 protein
MPVVSVRPGYRGEVKDRESLFHGNRVVYFNWEKHLMFCSPVAFPLPPSMPFAAVVEEVLPKHWGLHPDFARIDWAKARWTLDGAPFVPDPAKTLDELGVKHKSVLRLTTPGLDGYRGSAT